MTRLLPDLLRRARLVEGPREPGRLAHALGPPDDPALLRRQEGQAGAAIAPALYGILADIVSIRTTIFAMGLITSLILPTSLLVRRHLVSAGRKDLNALMSKGDSA